MLHTLGPRYDIDPHNVVKLMLGMPNYAEINSLMFSHTVLPNLRNLGLLTERTEGRYRGLFMLSDRRPEATELNLAAG